MGRGVVTIQTLEFSFRAPARHQHTVPTEPSLWGSTQAFRGPSHRPDAYFFSRLVQVSLVSGDTSYLLFLLLICSLTLFQTSASPPHPQPKLEDLRGKPSCLRLGYTGIYLSNMFIR